MTPGVPRGFRLAAVHSGIKQASTRPDVTLIVSDRPAAAAAVYTTNQVVAAPVVLDRQRTPSNSMRAIVVNSGNANACTGEQGMHNAIEMARLAAAACDVRPEEVLVMSTGIIGVQLPMDRVAAGITAAAKELAETSEAMLAAAKGIMTTDTCHKLAERRVETSQGTFQLTGFAKGAGMIGPRMATMLSVLMTDAPLEASAAQEILARVAERTFNCVSVEGHTSTNDTAIFMANGAAGGKTPLVGKDLDSVEQALLGLCTELARAIANDGEGATHLITIDVSGCQTSEEARTIARTIADSPLVKTAMAGADPNWGRIVSAAGYAGPRFDPSRVSLHLNGHQLYDRGAPVAFDAALVSESIRSQRDTHIELRLGEGTASARFWTCDLTTEYVHINADYHT